MNRRIRGLFQRGFRRKETKLFSGNRVEILVDGGAFFDAFVALVESAKSYVLVESYILSDDSTGWRVAKVLAAGARAGVEVALCYDGYGSLSLGQAFEDFLRKEGVMLLRFRPPSITRRVWPWSRRNHRKLLVVDGQAAIVGGMNLSGPYAATKDGGEGWRDTAVQISGPAVARLEDMFRELWSKYSQDRLKVPTRVPEIFPGGESVSFMGNFARPRRAFIRRAYLRAIVEARDHIRICNAYFVPDRIMVRALIRAARRGVSVEIIVAGATDVKTAMYATRAYYSRLLKRGIAIYEWHGRVLHAKTAVIDGQWSTIGSSNLDYLSSFRNLEVNAVILSERIGGAMDDQFIVDRVRSQQVELSKWRRRSWWKVLIERFFYLVRKAY